MKKKKGMSLVEVMVAMLILSIAILGGVSFFVSSFKVNYNYMDFATRLDHALRYVERAKVQRKNYPTYGSFANTGAEGGYTIFFIDSDDDDVVSDNPYIIESYPKDNQKIDTTITVRSLPTTENQYVLPDGWKKEQLPNGGKEYLLTERTESIAKAEAEMKLLSTMSQDYMYERINNWFTDTVKGNKFTSTYGALGTNVVNRIAVWDAGTKKVSGYFEFDFPEFIKLAKESPAETNVITSFPGMNLAPYRIAVKSTRTYTPKVSDPVETLERWAYSSQGLEQITSNTPPPRIDDDNDGGTTSNPGDGNLDDGEKFYTTSSYGYDIVGPTPVTHAEVPTRGVKVEAKKTSIAAEAKDNPKDLTGTPIIPNGDVYQKALIFESNWGNTKVSLATWKKTRDYSYKKGGDANPNAGKTTTWHSWNTISSNAAWFNAKTASTPQKKITKYSRGVYISVYPIHVKGSETETAGRRAKKIVDDIVENNESLAARVAALEKYATDNQLKIIKIPFINLYANSSSSTLSEDIKR